MRLVRLSSLVVLVIMQTGCAIAYKQSNNSLLQEVDVVLHEIDAMHHDHMHSQEASKKITPSQQPPAQTKSVATSSSSTGSSQKKTRIGQSSPAIDSQQVQQVKQQVQNAEAELAKLKGLLSTVEGQQPIKKENLQRTIRLNKGLVQTYDTYADAGRPVTAKNMQPIVQKRKAQVYQPKEMFEDRYEDQQRASVKKRKHNQRKASEQRVLDDQRIFEEDAYEFETDDSNHAYGQLFDAPWFTYRTEGHVITEIFATTRQVTGVQSQQVFLLPAARLDDVNGVDIKARSQFYFTGINGHLGLLVEAPKVFGAIPTADISGDFLGPLSINYFPQTAVPRLNATYGILLIFMALHLDWPQTSLLVGDGWYPMADPEVACSVDRVTYVGSLQEPLEKYFQVRVTQRINKSFEMIMAIYSAIDAHARTNLGIEYEQWQNPAFIGFQVQARATTEHGSILALAADLQTERPRLFDEAQLVLDADVQAQADVAFFTPITLARSFVNPSDIYTTKAGVTSFSVTAFGKINYDPFVFKAKGIFGSNLAHTFAGFAVVSRNQEPSGLGATLVDPDTCYGPMKFFSVMGDFSVDKKIEPGIFIGFIKNLGTHNGLFQFAPNPQFPNRSNNDRFLIYRYVPTLDYVLTIAPRVKWHVDPISVCGEIEYCRAAFGQINRCGTIDCAIPIDDVRFIFGLHYYF